MNLVSGPNNFSELSAGCKMGLSDLFELGQLCDVIPVMPDKRLGIVALDAEHAEQVHKIPAA